jgi:exopolyphosphatase/guanosine-5'-triphosphate,3'-diphosphate pyrophosphatase
MKRPLEKIASIDVGSNTLRFLIAEKTKEGFRPVFRDREIVRLGRNFYPHRLLSPQAMEAAIKVLSRFKIRAEKARAAQIIAVGTGVLREAENISFFLERVEGETGVSVRILKGPEEARIMAKGVLSVFPSIYGKSVIFDVGGGSTEFVVVKDGQIDRRTSLPLGVVELNERFLRSNPPKMNEVDSLKVHCQNILKKNLAKNDRITYIVGTAGTVTTLATMAKKLSDYDPDQINGTVLTKEYLLELSKKILALSFKKRAELTGLEPGRADIIGSGILLVLEIMDYFSQGSLLVSDAGLLEGLILEI